MDELLLYKVRLIVMYVKKNRQIVINQSTDQGNSKEIKFKGIYNVY